MDMSSVLAAVSKMFPSVNLSGAVEKAQEVIKETPDSLDGVSAAARHLGLNRQALDSIYTRYGQTMQARALCGLLGTTPEALKADADRIIGGSGTAIQAGLKAKSGHSKFPRLK